VSDEIQCTEGYGLAIPQAVFFPDGYNGKYFTGFYTLWQ
jgi:hypothetical protein